MCILYNSCNYLSKVVNHMFLPKNALDSTEKIVRLIILLVGVFVGLCVYGNFKKKQAEAIGGFYSQLSAYIFMLKSRICIIQSSENESLTMSPFLNNFIELRDNESVEEFRIFVKAFLNLFFSSNGQLPIIKPTNFFNRANERKKWVKNKGIIIKFLILSTHIGREKFWWDTRKEESEQLQIAFSEVTKAVQEIQSDIEIITNKSFGL